MHGTLLLICSDPPFAEDVSIALKDDYDVVSAHGEFDAVRVLLHTSPDLVLLDLPRSVCNSPAICREIRQYTHLTDAPIVLLVDFCVLHLVPDEALGLVMDCMAKPMPHQLLRLRLRNFMGLVRHSGFPERQKSAAYSLGKEVWDLTFDSVPDLVAIVDPGNTVIRVNRALAAHVGVEPHDLVGRKCFDVMHDGAPPEGCEFGRAMEGETVRSRIGDKRRHRVFDVTIAPVQDGDGAVIGCVHVARDVTAKVKAEAYAHAGQEILRILSGSHSQREWMLQIIRLLKEVADADAAGIRLEAEGDFPYFCHEGFPDDFLQTENSLVMRTTEGGVCRDEYGNVCLECTCGAVLCEATDPSNAAYTKGGSFWTNDSVTLLDLPEEEDVRVHPHNECIHQGFASVALVPVRAKGRTVGLIQLNAYRKGCFTLEEIETLEDIAQNIGEAMLRKQAEEEKAKLEGQLMQAQKMESIGRLAGGVAHDLNNMLGVIMGQVELSLMSLAPSDALYDGLLCIRSAAERSANFTRQLLAFGRQQPISPKVLDLNDSIESMVDMLRRVIGEDVRVVRLLQHDLWRIEVDPGQVDQLLANLCVNARDAIENTGTITIRTANATVDEATCNAQPELRPGEYVRLDVIDDGCGMDEETIRQAFEPFFTTKEVGKGTGLGLSTVFGIVKQNEGCLTVSSSPGQGTVFSIYLPRFRGELPQPHAADAAHTVPTGLETVMLVEDEETILDLAATMLKYHGYTVLAAASPEEALRLAGEYPGTIQLLMTDVIMPGMNGKDLAETLLASHPGMKCLFMSGYSADVLARHGVQDRIVHFIHKPFSMVDIAASVRAALDDRDA